MHHNEIIEANELEDFSDVQEVEGWKPESASKIVIGFLLVVLFCIVVSFIGLALGLN